MSWADGDLGPECECGDTTVVKRLPDGRLVALCLFHDGEAGRYIPLDEDGHEGQ